MHEPIERFIKVAKLKLLSSIHLITNTNCSHFKSRSDETPCAAVSERLFATAGIRDAERGILFLRNLGCS